MHRLLDCVAIAEEREVLLGELWGVWKGDRIQDFRSGSNDEKVAMILGLKGKASKDHVSIVVAFLKALWFWEFTIPERGCARTSCGMRGYNMDNIMTIRPQVNQHDLHGELVGPGAEWRHEAQMRQGIRYVRVGYLR